MDSLCMYVCNSYMYFWSHQAPKIVFWISYKGHCAKGKKSSQLLTSSLNQTEFLKAYTYVHLRMCRLSSANNFWPEKYVDCRLLIGKYLGDKQKDYWSREGFRLKLSTAGGSFSYQACCWAVIISPYWLYLHISTLVFTHNVQYTTGKTHYYRTV
jgi:hypothetical protein